MRKIVILLFCILIIPMSVHARKCNNIELENYREAINNLTFNVEYVPKGTNYSVFDETKIVELDNMFKIISPNMPSSYGAEFQDNQLIKYMVSSEQYSFIPGGVYDISVYNENCDNAVKVFQMMIPIYDKKNKNDVWFDGTYENNNKREINTKNIIAIRLLIILIVLIIIMIVSFILIRKNRRKIK